MGILKRQIKRIVSIILIITILIGILPNFGLLRISNAADFESGVILRLDTEKGIWLDSNGQYRAISLDIILKDINVTSLVIPIKFDNTKLTPAQSLRFGNYNFLSIANNVSNFTSEMGNELPENFKLSQTYSKTDWSNVANGEIVLEFSDDVSRETLMVQGERKLCTINFIVDASIIDLSQINTNLINVNEESNLFQIYYFEEDTYYEDVNTYFSLQGVKMLPSVKELSITTNPTKGVEYTHGEAIDLSDGMLTATYTDGTTKDVFMNGENVTVKTGEIEGAFADINNSTLTFEYEGKTVDLDINVIDPVNTIEFYDKNNTLKICDFTDGTPIPVELLFIKTITKSGVEEEIALTDSRVTLDSKEADVSKIKNPYYDESLGDYVGIQDVLVTYTDKNVTKTTSFSILVNDVVGEIKISTTNEPTKTHIINDKFIKDGSIEVIGKYSEIVLGEIAISSDSVKVTEDGAKVVLDKPGPKELTVSYAGKTTTYEIEVINTVTEIQVNMPEDYVEVKYNQELTAEDFAGITITEKNADGTDGDTKELEFTWIDTTSFNKESLSKQQLTINYPYDYPYGEKTIKDSIDVKVKNELLGIKIENLQSEYVYKDELDYEGAKLYVEYISGETGPYEIDETVLTNDFDNTKIGPQEVTFTYTDGIDSVNTMYSVNVSRDVLEAPECDTLEILEDTPLYELNDELQAQLSAEQKVYGDLVWKYPSQTLSIKNGETQTVKALYKMNDTYKEFYQDVEVSVEIKVKSENITTIELDKKGPNLTYFEGQTFNPDGIVLNVTYADGTTGIITGGYTIDGIETDKPLTLEDNRKTISVKYKDFDSIEIGQIEVKADYVTGIDLNTEGAKTTYKYNEESDLSNITVKRVMASGIEQEVELLKENSQYEVSDNYDKTDISSPQTITVTYNGSDVDENVSKPQATFNVKVNDYVAKIELPEETKTALEKEYLYGETVSVVDSNLNPLNITIYMASSVETPITKKLTLDMINADTTDLNTTEMTVEYGDAKAVLNISVKDYVEAIEIVSLPTKRIYKVGETLDWAGLIVRDVMASEATIEAKDTTLAPEQYEVSTLDSTVAGTKTITITRKDITLEPVTFTVLVAEDDENLEMKVKELPTGKTYYGKELDLTGGSVIIKLEGEAEGTVVSMTDEAITVEGYNKNKLGAQTIKLIYTYEELVDGNIEERTLEIELEIVVEDYPTDTVKLTAVPEKLTYKFGEELILVGGEIAKLMASGTEFAKNPLTMNMVSGFDSEKTGTQTITVTYDGLTTTYKVTVVDNIYGISMNSNPTKVTYKYGEELNIDGATINVEKDSGTKVIPVTAEMVTGYDKTKVGEQLITVTYEGFKTQFTVKVEKQVIPDNPEEDDSGNQGAINKAEYIVIFKDYDGTILKRIYVKQGESATPPIVSEREGYKFIGWDKEYSNIQEDLVITAMYKEITTENPVQKPGDNKEEPEEKPIETTPKPTQTLGEKDEVKEDKNLGEVILPALLGIAITGGLLLLIAMLNKKNVEIYVTTKEGRKLIAKEKISKTTKEINLDNYKEEIDSAESVELVIEGKTVEKLENETIEVVLNNQTQKHTVKENIRIK